MRLWSIHPRYLDSKGLVALWREGLLAKAVLSGETKGYRNHPQLARFKASPDPVSFIAAYLKEVHVESLRRGYHFDEKKIGGTVLLIPLTVTEGQIEYEWAHLMAKLKTRDPDRYRESESIKQPLPHPLFRVIKGGIALWEVVTA
jgi:Pyrimidine dimer DNA glycosylase